MHMLNMLLGNIFNSHSSSIIIIKNQKIKILWFNFCNPIKDVWSKDFFNIISVFFVWRRKEEEFIFTWN